MTLISNIDYSWTRKFYDSLVIINAIINIYTIVWVFRTVGINNISNIYLIRSTMDTLSVGLNRFLSGLFFISFISIPVSLGIIKNKRLYVISVINFVSLVLLIIFSGSRQNLIAVLSYTVLCIINCNLLYKSKYDKKRKINSKIGLLVTIFVFVLPFLYFSHKGISLIQFIKFRFIDVVAKKQSELGVIDPRILIIRQAAVGIKERPIFGHGIGTFMELNGIYSHNGYLNFAFEIGIIPFLIVLCYFLFSAIKGLISKRIILNNSMDELYIVSSSLFIVIAFVSNIFNDFLSSNTLWIAFILFNRSIKNIGFKESTDK